MVRLCKGGGGDQECPIDADRPFGYPKHKEMLMAYRGRFLVLLMISMVVLASCGGDGDGDGDAVPATSTTSASSDQDAGTETAATSGESSDETTTTTEPPTQEPVPGQQQAELVFDDGRSWALEGVCSYTPENTGAAAALWSVEVQAADAASLIAISAFPFDAENTTPFVTGSFVDADDNVFVVIEAEDVSDGSDLILSFGMHDGVKTIDDPIDFTATLTCEV
jgi:hypothetical protein